MAVNESCLQEKRSKYSGKKIVHKKSALRHMGWFQIRPSTKPLEEQPLTL